MANENNNAEVKIVKRAVRRRPGYPVGQPAPCFIVCGCGTEVDMLPGAGEIFTCTGCGTKYERSGWVRLPEEK